MLRVVIATQTHSLQLWPTMQYMKTVWPTKVGFTRNRQQEKNTRNKNKNKKELPPTEKPLELQINQQSEMPTANLCLLARVDRAGNYSAKSQNKNKNKNK